MRALALHHLDADPSGICADALDDARPTRHAATDPVLAGFGDGLAGLAFHGDVCLPAPAACRLATSTGCAVRAAGPQSRRAAHTLALICLAATLGGIAPAASATPARGGRALQGSRSPLRPRAGAARAARHVAARQPSTPPDYRNPSVRTRAAWVAAAAVPPPDRLRETTTAAAPRATPTAAVSGPRTIGDVTAVIALIGLAFAALPGRRRGRRPA